MRALLIATFIAATAQAAPQNDDIAFARNDKGVTISLSTQTCPFAGYNWYHIEDAGGKSLKVGCWTLATHRRIMLMDGKGGAEFLPLSRFSSNPHYGE